MTLSRTPLLAVLSLAALASAAGAQTANSPAAYGSVELAGNFQPDPHVVQVVAGGNISADALGSDCKGYISEAPDYELSYTGGSDYPLSFYVVGGGDTTLVINDPSGNWVCNDDFDSNSVQGAGVVLSDPPTGTYDIWIGTYSAGESGASAELWITELGTPWEVSGGPDAEQVPSDTNSSGGEPSLVASGTGFVVSRNGHILTNNHVTEGCAMLTFQIRGDLAVPATLLSSNATTDLALLKTALVTEPALFRGPRSIRLGDEVVVYGFPLLGDLSSQGNLTNGIVSALSGLGDDLSRLQMTAPIQPGNSGGPVLNRAGYIVGVVVETANDQYFREQRGTAVQNLNFAIHDALARSFLDTNNVEYATADQPDQTLSIADIAEQARHFTGQILCYQ